MTTKRTITRRILFWKVTVEQEFATEAEIASTGFEVVEDCLSKKIKYCNNCKEDTLARRREYAVGTYFTGLDFGSLLATVYSCWHCGHLYTPDAEHRVNYEQA